jgi:chromosome segregation ATPase
VAGFRISYSADEDFEPLGARAQLIKKHDNLKTALNNARYDLERKYNRAAVLTTLVENQQTILRQMKGEPAVSMALFQQQVERLARVSQDLAGVKREVKDLLASIAKGEKAVKDQQAQLMMLPNTSPTGRVLTFKRPGDDRT